MALRRFSILASPLIAILISAAPSPAFAFVDMCERDYNQCMDSCDRLPPGGDGSRRAQCVGQCGLIFMGCMGYLQSNPTRLGSQGGSSGPTGPKTLNPVHKQSGATLLLH